MKCYGCGKEIKHGDTYFESYYGEHLCEECGEDLYEDDFTQHDEFPLIDGYGEWDGSMYEGDTYREAVYDEWKEYRDWCKRKQLKPGHANSLLQYMEEVDD